MSNAFTDAMERANIKVGDFVANEKQLYGKFPIRKKHWESIQKKEKDFEKAYKYRKPEEKTYIHLWMYNQGIVKNMLQRHKDSIVIMSESDCHKYMDAYISYSTAFQRFVLKCDTNMRFKDLPVNIIQGQQMETFVNSYEKELGCKLDVRERLSDIRNKAMCHSVLMSDLLTVAIFNYQDSVIPVRRMNPINEINAFVNKRFVKLKISSTELIERLLNGSCKYEDNAYEQMIPRMILKYYLLQNFRIDPDKKQEDGQPMLAESGRASYYFIVKDKDNNLIIT